MSRLRFWAWPGELRRCGVLGMNSRNLDYIARLNHRRLYPRVDDKVLTKEICRGCGIPVPTTYVLLERYGDLRRAGELVGDRQEFVIKPARGARGRGVLVICQQDGQQFQIAGGPVISLAAVRYHLATILSGLFSLGGRPDRAIIEQRIARHPVFDRLAVEGTPDVRVIVHRGEPTMAMLRLPTCASRGRANLHQGALGVGVDIATGRTLSAMWRDRFVALHPDTQEPLVGVAIPHWSEVLGIASRLSEALGLGYVGVDVVLDAQVGPIVLEANARPGLSIQIANGCGLLPRLQEQVARSGASAAPAGERRRTMVKV